MNDRAVFFDLDGTLTDPKPGITRCIRHAMAALGRTPPEADDLHWCIGPPLRGSFARLLDSSDGELLDRALALYRDRFGTIGEHFALAGLFERVHGSELDGRRTDKGDLIAHVLAQERLEPSRVVMVGDREHDAMGAARCAVRCVGVSYGYGTEAELRAQGVAGLARSPCEIVSLVEALFEKDREA
jgi:phosphoglycolate phosphatase